uniref:Alpha-2-macroglobulin bait region domain-containing protein n=1 Tax=Arion vulgaris TaxID=1028688 RepID=A0A0B7BF68_9EUPU
MKQMWLSTVLLIALVVHIPSVRSQTDNPNQPSNQTQAPKAASYWVTMPDSLRPGQQLHLTVQILSGQDPVTVNLAITYSKYINPDNTLKTVFTSSDYEVLPGDARTIPIDIPRNLMSPSNIWRGFYTVIVTGHGRTVNFSHNRSVSIFEKSASVLIATDKGIYKPGQTVNFRVFVMDSNLKVLIIPMDIFIKDPKNNIIKQYLRVNGSKLHGVFQDSFQLADSTMKGDWTMNVATDQAHDEMRTFTVDDYVIPNFAVQVETPAIPLSSSPSMPMKVKSMYTFGQPVTDGQVHVCITMNYIFPLWDFGQVQNPKIDDFCLDGKLNRDGEFTFQVTNQQLLAVVLSQNPYANDISYQTFKVEANVTETTTQRMQTGSSVMQIYFSPLTVQFLTVSKTSFKPGLASTAYLEVKKVDGTALSAQEIQNIVVNFNVTYEVNIPPEEQQKITDMPHVEEQITTNTPVEEEQSITNNSNSDTVNIFRRRPSPFLPFTKTTRTEVLKLDAPEQSLSETGIIPITFYAPPDAISIAIVARCKKPFEDNTVYYFISKYNSPSNTFMQLSTPLKTPDIGDIITLTAESSELVKKFTYQVISKGMLVRSGTVTSPTSEGSKTIPFDLEITQAMAPTVQVLIFYIREQDSEFVGDAIALSVNGLFQKKVSFKFSKEQVEPGEPVDLIIKSEPGSTVYYSAIDKSVELHKTGNDVTVDLVRKEQLEYDYGVMSAYSFFWGWPNYYHGKDISSVFQESKVLIFSDGNVYKQPIRLYDDGIVYDSVEGIDRYTLTALQPTDNPAQGFLPEGKVRNNFIETWFFNFTVMPSDSNGEIVVPLTSPDTITKYIARIFSIDQDFGLSVGSEVASVTIFRKLFVSLDLPAVIIRYENFCFTASVFSYYQKQIPLLLTLEKSASYNGTYVKRDGNTITETSENIACTEYHGDISANEVRSSMFCFTPIVLGNIKLKVSVLTTEEGLSDAVEHVILSKPEGVTYSSNYPSLANLSSGFWQNDFDVAFPSNAVDGSQN